MQRTAAAIRQGTEGPPSLGTYRLLKEFWQRLGMRRADIQELSAREFEDYLTIIELEIREENAARRRGNGRGPGN